MTEAKIWFDRKWVSWKWLDVAGVAALLAHVAKHIAAGEWESAFGWLWLLGLLVLRWIDERRIDLLTERLRDFQVEVEGIILSACHEVLKEQKDAMRKEAMRKAFDDDRPRSPRRKPSSSMAHLVASEAPVTACIEPEQAQRVQLSTAELEASLESRLKLPGSELTHTCESCGQEYRVIDLQQIRCRNCCLGAP